jgi:hypothetical protein
MVDISFSLVPFASLFRPSRGSDAAAGVAFGGPDAVELALPPNGHGTAADVAEPTQLARLAPWQRL